MNERLNLVENMQEQFVVVRDLALKVVQAQDKLLVQQLEEVIHFAERYEVGLIVTMQPGFKAPRVLCKEKSHQELKLLDRIVHFSVEQENAVG